MMAYKRTGNPPGRPKTKEYVTMLARVPAELAELVRKYATEHGQLSVSELIREGLEWRIGDGDPRGTGMYLAQPTGMTETATETVKAIQQQLLAMALDLDRLRTEHSRNTGNTQTVVEGDGTGKVASQQGRVQQASETTGHTSTPEPHAVPSYPPFDTSKYRLGKLCPKGHDYYGTGLSLRRLQKGDCVECNRLEKQARRQAAAQQRAA